MKESLARKCFTQHARLPASSQPAVQEAEQEARLNRLSRLSRLSRPSSRPGWGLYLEEQAKLHAPLVLQVVAVVQRLQKGQAGGRLSQGSVAWAELR